ncbi:ABC transporter permease [Actinotalea sp.]|uniref:ABC transporter permease n=1 Tax=Actinotalea sp. TaxID=1872145 RepID=UPI003567DAD3
MSDLPGFLAKRWDEILLSGVEHLQLVLVPIIAATIIGVLVALLVERHAIVREVVTTTTATLLTIPSLALFVLLIPLVGLGPTGAYIGLTLYALYPIFVTSVTGLSTVDKSVIESARGMGMGPVRRVTIAKLPLAWPVILAGIRTTTTVICATAVAAAYTQGGGYGTYLFSGVNRLGGANALASIIVGIVGTVLVALLLEAAYAVLERLTVSRGIR